MEISATVTTGMTGVFGSRMILNVRHAASKENDKSAVQIPTHLPLERLGDQGSNNSEVTM